MLENSAARHAASDINTTGRYSSVDIQGLYWSLRVQRQGQHAMGAVEDYEYVRPEFIHTEN
jgi:hypothetical protein